MAGQRGGKHASAAADIQHFTLACGVSVDSSSWLPTSSPSRLNTPGNVYGQPVDVALGPPNSRLKLRLLLPDDYGKGPQRRALSTCSAARQSASIGSALRTPLRFSPHDENYRQTASKRQNIHQLELRFGLHFGQ